MAQTDGATPVAPNSGRTKSSLRWARAAWEKCIERGIGDWSAIAIKVLPTNLSSDPSLKQRLEREAEAVSKLSHPHICTLHDIGHQDGIAFLVMGLLEGETIEKGLTKRALSAEQTVRYAAQIADALAKAHKKRFETPPHNLSNVTAAANRVAMRHQVIAQRVEILNV